MMDALGATIKVKGQQDYRRPAEFRDQHGRGWATQIDTQTMAPCVALSPYGWSAPLPALVPPQKYLTTVDGRFGMPMIETLLPLETYGGSHIDTVVDDGEFPDVEMDSDADGAIRVADRYADADQYLDLEDAIDPDAAPARVTVKKRTR
jgi:hypothetical protein